MARQTKNVIIGHTHEDDSGLLAVKDLLAVGRSEVATLISSVAANPQDLGNAVFESMLVTKTACCPVRLI